MNHEFEREEEEVKNAIDILEEKWKHILSHWKGREEDCLDQSELLDLETNIETLKKQQKTVESIKGLMETMERIKKDLTRLRNSYGAMGGKKEMQSKLIVLESERKSINKELLEMHLDGHFISKYMGFMDDYRVHTMPLPHGFMCHKSYQNHLDYLKKSIVETEKDMDARREMLEELRLKERDADLHSGGALLKPLFSYSYQALKYLDPHACKVPSKVCRRASASIES